MKNYNRFLLFCFALIPGAGYMYLGLMRRGVEAMILFVTGIAIPAWIGMPALAAIIAIPLWFYCFFDSFYQRSNLETGLEIEDRGLVDLLTWLNGNYHLLGIGLIVLGILALLNMVGQDLIYSANVAVKEVIQHLRGYLPALLLIIAGIYLLRKTRQQHLDFEREYDCNSDIAAANSDDVIPAAENTTNNVIKEEDNIPLE